jgi:anti-sigma B factor antagonist
MELLGRHTTLDGRPVLHLSGEIDIATLPLLRDHLTRAISLNSGAVVFVDLDGLDALDDTGVGMLLGAAGQARAHGGDVVLVCTSERLLARFALTGLDRALTIVASAVPNRS